LGVGRDAAVVLEDLDSMGEVLRGEHGSEAHERDVRGEEKDGRGEGDGERRGQGVARAAGSRSAAKDGPVRSKKCDIERV
jgi:hypothetical protein